jgi:CRP-like cAMP-binding protein
MLERRHFKAGEALIRENELGESAYIIEKGRVEITKELGAGARCGWPSWAPARRSAR